MNNILLSNLIKIRWIAIIGQFFTICLVYFFLKIDILIIELLIIVSISVLINAISYLLQKKDNILSEKKAFFFLFYDTSQLGMLLYLTGGIFNPFCILIIAPVIISATYLQVYWTVILSIFSIIIILIINKVYVPIYLQSDLILPGIFREGLIIALIITIIFIAAYTYLFANSARKISEALSETKLQLSNQKNITEIGSLSAAAVHELSTPLNTIYLILNDFLKNNKLINDSDIIDDVQLLKSQADRCKEILLRISKNQLSLEDDFLHKTYVSDLIKRNFNKFNKNKKLKIDISTSKQEPQITFTDELMYALGNLIQNAIIHSKALVTVFLEFETDHTIIKICDDGPGFPKDILDRIGEPYVSKNKTGMGLGIFIAINLIKNLSGEIIFYNSKDNNAIVKIKINNN